MDEARFLLVCEGLFEPWDKASMAARQAASEEAKPIQPESAKQQVSHKAKAERQGTKYDNKKARHSSMQGKEERKQ
jgi:hypothetical protein